MSRLTIDITEEQHQTLKAMAALDGKTIKQFALERLFNAEQPDLSEIKALLAGRVAQAQRGEVIKGSISDIAEQAIRAESAQ